MSVTSSFSFVGELDKLLSQAAERFRAGEFLNRPGLVSISRSGSNVLVAFAPEAERCTPQVKALMLVKALRELGEDAERKLGELSQSAVTIILSSRLKELLAESVKFVRAVLLGGSSIRRPPEDLRHCLKLAGPETARPFRPILAILREIQNVFGVKESGGVSREGARHFSREPRHRFRKALPGANY